MKRDVLIRILGMQSDIYKDADKVEIITSGSYYKKNNKHYLMYDEIGENQDEVTKNIARFDNEEFHIIDNLGTYYIAFNVNSDLFAGKTAQEAAYMRLAISLLIASRTVSSSYSIT